jgi:KUP system potassium uptake protein
MLAVGVRREALGCGSASASWFLRREVPVPSMQPDMPLWQETLSASLTRNAVGATDYSGIPTARVVGLGMRVEM